MKERGDLIALLVKRSCIRNKARSLLDALDLVGVAHVLHALAERDDGAAEQLQVRAFARHWTGTRRTSTCANQVKAVERRVAFDARLAAVRPLDALHLLRESVAVALDARTAR